MRVVLGLTLASAALTAVDFVMLHTFDGTGLIIFCVHVYALRFVNVLYV